MVAQSVTAKSASKSTASKPAAKRTLARKVPTQERIAVVPDKEIAERYIGRFFNGHREFVVFKFALATGRNILTEGPTGAGKTMAVQAFAAEEEMKFYATPSNTGMEPSQLFGKYIPATGGGFVWQDGPVTDIVRHGGVLLINEVNFIPERISTVLFSLLDGRREIALTDHKGEVIPCHPNTLIVADMNPPTYEGTRPLNKAFRNRFAIQLPWDYDLKAEEQLVQNAALRTMVQAIRDKQTSGMIRTPISTNMQMEFVQVAFSLGFEFAVDNFVSHFSLEERDVIRTVVQTFTENIKADCVIYSDNKNDNDDWKVGDWTPEDGAYGIDWTFSDEEA